jgi:hypothetical protein
LQLPLTHYFLSSTWDYAYREKSQREVLSDISDYLYPDQKELVIDGFLALEETDPQKINSVLDRLEELITKGQLGRPGVIGRKLFIDGYQVARDLVSQLKIRAAREHLLHELLFAQPDLDEAQRLVENYFDLLLAWDRQTGWEKLIEIGIWRLPIYAPDRRFQEAMANLKRLLGRGSRATRYAAISSFLEPISKRLCQKYSEDAVMIGCIDPMRAAVIGPQ